MLGVVTAYGIQESLNPRIGIPRWRVFPAMWQPGALYAHLVLGVSKNLNPTIAPRKIQGCHGLKWKLVYIRKLPPDIRWMGLV